MRRTVSSRGSRVTSIHYQSCSTSTGVLWSWRLKCVRMDVCEHPSLKGHWKMLKAAETDPSAQKDSFLKPLWLHMKSCTSSDNGISLWLQHLGEERFDLTVRARTTCLSVIANWLIANERSGLPCRYKCVMTDRPFLNYTQHSACIYCVGLTLRRRFAVFRMIYATKTDYCDFSSLLHIYFTLSSLHGYWQRVRENTTNPN